MHKYVKLDVRVFDDFIQKFANKYLGQRSHTNFDYKDIGESPLEFDS